MYMRFKDIENRNPVFTSGFHTDFRTIVLRKPIDWGGIYEGQGKATLYIRNSPKHQALPGTYYIAVYKIIQKSSFAYSLTWK